MDGFSAAVPYFLTDHKLPVADKFIFRGNKSFFDRRSGGNDLHDASRRIRQNVQVKLAAVSRHDDDLAAFAVREGHGDGVVTFFFSIFRNDLFEVSLGDIIKGEGYVTAFVYVFADDGGSHVFKEPAAGICHTVNPYGTSAAEQFVVNEIYAVYSIRSPFRSIKRIRLCLSHHL